MSEEPSGDLSTNQIPDEAIRKNHEQVLQLAHRSLMNDSLNDRDFYNMTMAIDPLQLPKARKIILKAFNEISKSLQTGRPREVYNLSINLFPMKQPQNWWWNITLLDFSSEFS